MKKSFYTGYHRRLLFSFSQRIIIPPSKFLRNDSQIMRSKWKVLENCKWFIDEFHKVSTAQYFVQKIRFAKQMRCWKTYFQMKSNAKPIFLPDPFKLLLWKQTLPETFWLNCISSRLRKEMLRFRRFIERGIYLCNRSVYYNKSTLQRQNNKFNYIPK